MAIQVGAERLFAGPPPEAGAETYAAYRARLGRLPSSAAGDGRNGQDRAADGFRADLIETMEASGLLGRGGAGFPVGRKWRSVAERAADGAVVVANGAEGEPRSAKDRTLMALRPHLVIDGAILAAEAVGAQEAILYVGTEHRAAVLALRRALAERATEADRGVRGGPKLVLVEAPVGYVSGESSAAVHYLNDADARPTTIPPRPYRRGVRDLPTLVQNVESLAYAALIARFGDAWYRSAGRGATRGTALVTLSGPVSRPGVREIEYGATIREVVGLAGGATADVQAVLLGGYFGGWASVLDVLDVPLDPATFAVRGVGLGCGLIGLLPAATCGVRATSQVMDYMAGESARQCGPCIFGLGAIAGTLGRLAVGSAADGDLDDLARWANDLAGRGACRHPDGAVGLLQSGLRVFADEFELHVHGRRCSHPAAVARVA
jgi:NADH:ubiquinone oxidoreductase subunit F (NADH-binding)